MLKIVLVGTGRMGRQVAKKLAEEKDDFRIVAAISASDSPDIGKDLGLLSGIQPLNVSILGVDAFESVLEKTKPDVVVDFTMAESCMKNMKIAAKKKINMVVGTTGFTPEQLNELKKLVKENGVGMVLSPNMSVGVNVYWKLIKEATRMLKDYDIEVIEAHHRFKKDAPSGTAVKTAEIIAKELGKDLKDAAVYGRSGLCPRKEGEIGIHAVRAGDIVGDHTVLYSTLGERIEVKHMAHSREAFASGVPKAVRFIAGKKGFYGMDDVLGFGK